MHPIVSKQLPVLRRLCEHHLVSRLELCGSAARDDFDPSRSDIDLLVEFRPEAAGRIFQSYFGLLADLEQLFGRPVDLVMTRAVRNRYFLEAIQEERELLYAA